MTVSVFVVDGRPVRLSRLKTCLKGHPKITLAGAASSLRDAQRQIEVTLPDAVLVGGELIEMTAFDAFAETLRNLRVVLSPVWVFPFSRAEVGALFGPEAPGAIGDGVPEGDTAFLTETIQGAVMRAQLEMGRPGRRKAAAPPLPALRPILIGASTGGVEALQEILSHFTPECPPVLIVQHMRAQFTHSFIEGLKRACRAEVAGAWDGAPLQRGRIYVCPDNDRHLALSPGSVPSCRLLAKPPRSGHRPSVDVLFTSGAEARLAPVAALLTGMGSDGAEGLLAIRRSGGHTIAQDRATSAVYGMPRAAQEIGAAVEVLPLEEIGPALLRATARAPVAVTARAS